ncbi:hypothetical protein [Collimonas antrihumi]|uniref:hypothetical protein n=1 Tax=Collimonas antrihumi TaxID=1940615 RepID=UPI001B8D3CFA|nr:hypothetical protein [Collimonas antrihumi]
MANFTDDELHDLIPDYLNNNLGDDRRSAVAAYRFAPNSSVDQMDRWETIGLQCQTEHLKQQLLHLKEAV